MKKIIGLTIVTLFLLTICFTLGDQHILAQSTMDLSQDTNAFHLTFVDLIQLINNTQIVHYHESLMNFGPRYTGSSNCQNASDYLFNTFSQLGLSTVKHQWNFNGFKSTNIEATITGSSSDNVIYIISAHYDCTLGSLGADDDGSGIAALLAIAEVMAEYTFHHTIRFVAFSGEEVGTYGSFAYAKDCYQRQDDIKAVLNLDMIGFANTIEGGKKIRFHCPKRSEWIAEKAYEISLLYEPLLDMTVEIRPNYIGADHQAFVDYGYDGVWIAHVDGYPYANTPDDNPEYLNWSYLLKATQMMGAILAEMANEPLDLHIQLIRPYEATLYFKENRVFKLDFGRLWAKELRGITILLGQVTAEAIVKSSNEIEYVVFCLNNNFMNFDSTPPYTWSIQGRHAPPIGSYILRVYVFDKLGHVASDEMEIFSLSTHYHYRPW